MGVLSVEGMAAIEKSKKEHIDALNLLTSKPFNINNAQQIIELKKHIGNFELSVHQMQLFQGMNTGWKAWGASWIVGTLLPIPDFARYFISLSLYCGIAGFVLQCFNQNDFYNQLEEMKIIYNWCLKKNLNKYDGTDNTAILSHPTIQHLIKLIAPLCSTEFMLVWKKITAVEEPKSTLGSAVSYAYSLFAQPKVTVDSNRLQDLKASVERRELDQGVFKGCEEAILYFATNPSFRDLLKTKISQPIAQAKALVPTVGGLTFSNTSS